MAGIRELMRNWIAGLNRIRAIMADPRRRGLTVAVTLFLAVGLGCSSADLVRRPTAAITPTHRLNRIRIALRP